MKLLNFLKSKLAITALAIAVNITVIVIDVHSSSSNPPIVKSTITQPQIHIQLVHTLTGHKKAIFGVPAIAISPDGKTLASSNEDGTIHIWQINYIPNHIEYIIATSRRAGRGLGVGFLVLLYKWYLRQNSMMG
ncbi:WD40 domain-containing protein [Nostoc sp. CHAB 5834]|nr:WD40 domain-containing protein [Nostoc sp. CHAB 5834]